MFTKMSNKCHKLCQTLYNVWEVSVISTVYAFDYFDQFTVYLVQQLLT